MDPHCPLLLSVVDSWIYQRAILSLQQKSVSESNTLWFVIKFNISRYPNKILVVCSLNTADFRKFTTEKLLLVQWILLWSIRKIDTIICMYHYYNSFNRFQVVCATCLILTQLHSVPIPKHCTMRFCYGKYVIHNNIFRLPSVHHDITVWFNTALLKWLATSFQILSDYRLLQASK